MTNGFLRECLHETCLAEVRVPRWCNEGDPNPDPENTFRFQSRAYLRDASVHRLCLSGICAAFVPSPSRLSRASFGVRGSDHQFIRYLACNIAQMAEWCQLERYFGDTINGTRVPSDRRAKVIHFQSRFMRTTSLYLYGNLTIIGFRQSMRLHHPHHLHALIYARIDYLRVYRNRVF